MIASTAPSARFAASSASRNAPRLSKSRALVRSAIGPWRSIPMFAAAVNFSRDVCGAREQALQLVAQGHGEAGGEGAAIAAIEVGERGPQLGLEPGAAGRGQQAGRRGAGDGGDGELGGNFKPNVNEMTKKVQIYPI